MHKRVTLTPKQKTQKLNEQEWKCGCGCGEDLVKGNISFDHKLPIWKRRKRKWSKQDEYNGQYALREDPCHKLKTAKEAPERAHYARLEKERLGLPKRKRAKAKIQGRKEIPSRPFQKRKKT